MDIFTSSQHTAYHYWWLSAHKNFLRWVAKVIKISQEEILHFSNLPITCIMTIKFVNFWILEKYWEIYVSSRHCIYTLKWLVNIIHWSRLKYICFHLMKATSRTLAVRALAYSRFPDEFRQKQSHIILYNITRYFSDDDNIAAIICSHIPIHILYGYARRKNKRLYYLHR